MSPYQPDFDLQRLRGEEAERYVRNLRAAVGAGTIEVKRDEQAHKYGNHYVEFECRSQVDGQYHPSGIATTKATTWAIYIDGSVTFVPTWVMRLVAEKYGLLRECTYGGNPTRGRAVPLSKMLPGIVEVMHAPATGRQAA